MKGDSDEGQRPDAAGDDGRGDGGGDEEDVSELPEGHRVEDTESGDDGKGCLGGVCLKEWRNQICVESVRNLLR